MEAPKLGASRMRSYLGRKLGRTFDCLVGFRPLVCCAPVPGGDERDGFPEPRRATGSLRKRRHPLAAGETVGRGAGGPNALVRDPKMAKSPPRRNTTRRRVVS